ncbi:HNH endonuclease [Pseudochelatococcus lubricantis]|uniref:HNH endonuclease signature motif containing protein n=1 Tax=Pseudochelatococcus lubricantis TaxID=1538102 RepID=UPI0035E9F068
MAFAPKRLCSCGRYAVSRGESCPCRPAQKAEADARRPNARERGYDSAWDKARASYLASHPTCIRCGAPATVVDHVIPHRGDRALFWNKVNWQQLCVQCHSGWKQSQERRYASTS